MGWRERKRGNLVEIVGERRRFKIWYDSDKKIFTYSGGRERARERKKLCLSTPTCTKSKHREGVCE